MGRIVKSSLKSSLKRTIGTFEATIFGVGIILGAGIYSLIGPAAGSAGNSLWLSFIIGAVISSFTGLSYAELSTMFPRAAAEYVYVKRASGSRFLAFMLAWLIIFAGVAAASTVAVGFAGYLRSFLYAPTPVIAIALIGLLSVISFIGIEESSKVNVLFTGIEIFGLVLIIILGMSRSVNLNYLQSPFGLEGIVGAAALVFFAYIGFEDIVNLAEETERPAKTIPKALILSILITTILYILLATSVVRLAGGTELSKSEAPIAYAASTVLGANAFVLLSAVALFATANTVLILLIVGSRMIYGVARDGSLPVIFSAIHKSRGTPWAAALAIMIASMLFAAVGDLRVLASVANFAAFAIFFSVNLSLIWLRFKMPEAERPFRVPLTLGKLPIIPTLGLISCVILISYLDLLGVILGIAALAIGGSAYIISKAKTV
jgi:APA family basic amino acid/polyamine antiporter